MSESGKFNTNSKALVNRIQAHERFGSKDLNQWIFQHLNLAPDKHVLDLGCGTGKQTISIAENIGEYGSVTAIDLSQESLDKLRKQSIGLGFSERITTIRSNLDNIAGEIRQDHYDNVVSSYALYYCTDAEKMFSTIFEALKPGGIVFFCGPSKNNNAEIKQFHYSLQNQAPIFETFASEFMERTGQECLKNIFGKVEISEFSNPLRFDSKEALYDYWSSYNLYDEKLDAIFRERAEGHFSNEYYFETVKRVVGVRAIKEF